MSVIKDFIYKTTIDTTVDSEYLIYIDYKIFFGGLFKKKSERKINIYPYDNNKNGHFSLSLILPYKNGIRFITNDYEYVDVMFSEIQFGKQSAFEINEYAIEQAKKFSKL